MQDTQEQNSLHTALDIDFSQPYIVKAFLIIGFLQPSNNK